MQGMRSGNAIIDREAGGVNWRLALEIKGGYCDGIYGLRELPAALAYRYNSSRS